MSKYIQLYKEMVKENKELFHKFKEVHDKYEKDEEKYQEEFNNIGEKVFEIIRDYELRLTSRAESGQYAKYSSNLAEKFWERIRKDYPQIDFVGTTVS